jgi:sulfopyruvate decarboxylase TPP-binding subunit
MTMFSGEQIAAELKDLGITHVVWLPDSTLGQWESALSSTIGLKLVRVCREGEAWAIAAGLYLGGARPLVLIQCTGLFDSGDSLRCALFDYGLPLFAVIGYRSALNPAANDSARTFTEPNLRSWGIDYRLIDSAEKVADLRTHYTVCRQANRPGAVLIAEGRM